MDRGVCRIPVPGFKLVKGLDADIACSSRFRYNPDSCSNQDNHIDGELAEWSNAAVLKTVDCNRSGGSNPSLSATLDLETAVAVSELDMPPNGTGSCACHRAILFELTFLNTGEKFRPITPGLQTGFAPRWPSTTGAE